MSKQGFVYVAVQKGSLGYCKVGKTKDPVGREKTLPGSGLAQIEIVESVHVNDMGAVENAFHKILPETNRKGEWFNIETERVLPMLRCLGSIQGQQPRLGEAARSHTTRTQPTSDLPGKTPQVEFRQLIVDVLEELGGSGHAKEVTARVGQRIRLRTGDLERYKSGQVVWENSVAWARQKMKDEGILKSDSPHGRWELANASPRRLEDRKTDKPSRTSGALSGRTPQVEFRQLIVDVLEELGGSGRAKEVTARVGQRARLRTGDLERYESGQVVWENSVAWARQKMKDEGILKSDSPRGFWQLA